jgi:DNA-binding response OmpR family regulator
VFEADLQVGQLRKQGLNIKLQEQPFQVLAMLLERSGQVVTGDELQKKLGAPTLFADFDRNLNKGPLPCR